MRALKAAGLYFVLVFGAGFVLGMIRQMLVVPRIGVMWAELLEMPFMLVAIVYAAGFTTRRFSLPPRVAPRLAAGVGALALLFLAEAAMVIGLRGLTLAEYVETREPVSGAVYLAMLVLFAVMPAALGMSRCKGASRI